MDLGRFNKIFFFLCLSTIAIYSKVDGVSVATETLWKAVKDDDPSGIRDAFENHADVNAKNEKGLTALHMAVEQSSTLAISALVKMGADKEAQNNCSDRPIHLATAKGYEKAVAMLIVAGADSNAVGCRGISPLLLASRTGKTGVARLIRALQYTHNPGNGPSVEEATKQLLIAVKRNQPTPARDALEAGADIEAVESNGNRPLHIAAMDNSWEVLSVLIKAGANVNALNDYRNTPMHVAIANGALSSVAFLAVAGTDLEIEGNGSRTPLLRAHSQWSRESPTVDLLRALGGWRFSKL